VHCRPPALLAEQGDPANLNFKDKGKLFFPILVRFFTHPTGCGGSG
jgi:hypothetical protein